jgi:hypothetical protein
MRTVNISVHTYSGLRSDLSFRPDDIRIVFAAAGIDLVFRNGEHFPDDPFFWKGYKNLLLEFSRNDTTAGHLIIGGQYPGLDPGMAGGLLDPDHRGLCADYTSSDYIANHGQPALLQCCAHEIGHMLNLSHDDNAPDLGAASPGYLTTMDQLSNRTLIPAQIAGAWNVASKEASSKKQHAIEPYYFPQSAPTVCLPLALTARLRLNQMGDGSLLPWRGRFEQGEIVEIAATI